MTGEDHNLPTNDQQAIGRCRFSQLPERYQAVFKLGANNVDNALFVAEKNPESVILAIPFYLLFSFIPLIGLYECREFFGSWRALGWIPPVVVSCYGFRAIQSLVKHYRHRRKGVIQYGLLLDRENLVMQEIAMLNPWHCIFIPRANIRRFYSESEGGGSGGGYRGIALKVAYVDRNGKLRSLKLGSASSLEVPPYRLDDMLTEFPRD